MVGHSKIGSKMAPTNLKEKVINVTSDKATALLLCLSKITP